MANRKPPGSTAVILRCEIVGGGGGIWVVNISLNVSERMSGGQNLFLRLLLSSKMRGAMGKLGGEGKGVFRSLDVNFCK